MDNALYINIARQSGLMKEMSVIANNIANVNTNGFRREGGVFSEFVARAADTGVGSNFENSVSMGRLGAHYSDFSQGGLDRTGGALDFAIDGKGFFRVQTQAGDRLTRAGRFMTDKNGLLVTSEGYAVLDDSGSQIQIPPSTGSISVSNDGSISADGKPLGKIGVVTASPDALIRAGDNLWALQDGKTYGQKVNSQIAQGYLEGSNVNSLIEMARMIEVQRAYEAGQKLLDIEDGRIGKTIQTISRPP